MRSNQGPELMGGMITLTVDAHDLRTVLAYGNGHAHTRPATWDRNGLPCNECLALGRLQAACDQAQRATGSSPRKEG